ncbi:MAG: 2'-5' RNA ligase family protein [Nitrososphaera sp.]|nr:2'-5' RNA ligase family protein [Nitrososphaera sp.]
MVKYFIFLEITDPEINALIWAITEIVTGQRPTQPFHMTVRGPYEERICMSTLKECQEAMSHDVLKISRVGRFSNPGEETVYLRIDSPNLRKIWWKPDYPIEKFGFNPHISLYRGPDRQLADRIAAFLEKEDITLLCAEYRLVPHVTKQLDMFPLSVPITKQFLGLLNSRRIHTTFLMRLEHMVRDYKRSPSVGSQVRSP